MASTGFRRQAGFTLIELVMVIVILGVLAAVALPKFVDLSSDAQAAATQGVAGGVSSASAINYAQRKINASNGFAITDCAHAVRPMQGQALPTGYSVGDAGGFPLPIAPNANVECTVYGPKSTQAQAFVTGIN